jgi:hypothetical protein
MSFSQITDHPDYEEIVSKIVTGDDPKDICQWLKIKFSDKDQKHLQLNIKLIQDFIDKHVNLDEQLKKDVLAIKNGKNNIASDYKIPASLANNKTYVERLTQLADTKIDIEKMCTELILICRSRMEQVFDKIQENPGNVKGDYVLLKYFETLFVAMEKLDKFVNKTPDQVIQVNIQNQIADQHVAFFQEAIRETLAHMDTESALLFVEILTSKINSTKIPKQSSPLTPDNYEAEAKLLKEVIIPKLEK